MNETAKGQESASVLALLGPFQEEGEWLCRYRVDKWNHNEDFEAGFDPDDVLVGEKNLLVNGGISLLEDLLIGAGGTAYTSSGNAYLAVGTDAATPPAATQTTLVAETARVSATAVVANQTVTFQASFGAGVGTGIWQEAGVLNAAAAGTLLNRLQQNLGTKPAGAVWVLTLNIVIS